MIIMFKHSMPHYYFILQEDETAKEVLLRHSSHRYPWLLMTANDNSTKIVCVGEEPVCGCKSTLIGLLAVVGLFYVLQFPYPQGALLLLQKHPWMLMTADENSTKIVCVGEEPVCGCKSTLIGLLAVVGLFYVLQFPYPQGALLLLQKQVLLDLDHQKDIKTLQNSTKEFLQF